MRSPDCLLLTIITLASLSCGKAYSNYPDRPEMKTTVSSAQESEAAKLPTAEPSEAADSRQAPTPPPPPLVVAPGAVPASGTVSITFNLVPPTPAGPYRNRGHVRSIWLTDANDTYIKTIHAFAGVRAVHLKRWFSFTNNAVDATSGATQTTVAAGMPITSSWDIKDKQGVGLKTGMYKLWMEFTEANTPALDAGKKAGVQAQVIDNTNGYEFFVLPFSVGTQASTKVEPSNPVFKDISIKHTP